jgi:hypothetical protein
MPLLDLNQQTVSRLGLEPIKGADGKYLYNGCIPTRVIDFKLNYQEHTKGEFKDLKVPVLQVEFENFKLNPTDPDRFYTHSFKVVGTKQLVVGTQDQYENRKEVDIDADTIDLWKGIKHFLENLTESPNYRNIANIPKADSIKYFDLPGLLAPADRIKKYEDFFNYLIAFVLGDGKDIKSQLLDKEGKALPMWIKMLPNYDKDAKRNAKYYAISRFINQGVFEAMKTDKGLPLGSPKVIRVKPTERLELTAAPAPASTGGYSPGSLPTSGGNLDPTVAALLRG